MPQVTLSANAMRNMDRLRAFLRPKNPAAARRAAQAIKKTILLLADNPQMGRPIDDMPDEYREVVITFGKDGYLARYQFDEAADTVVILAIRHQRELGY